MTACIRVERHQLFSTVDGDPEEIYGFKARLWARVVVGDVVCGHTRGARTTGPHTRPTRPDIHDPPAASWLSRLLTLMDPNTSKVITDLGTPLHA